MKHRMIYAWAAIVAFILEILIAVFVHDAIVRPYVGDSLAVVLVYLVVRATMPLKMLPAVLMALAVATVVELAQLWHLLDALHLRHNRLARTVLGGSFDLKDFAAYGIGAAAIIMVEQARRPRFR